MGLVPRFKSSDIKKRLKATYGLVDNVILMRFQYIGERFVANARDKANFKDQTGNLRSSIGYIVLKNGKKVSGSSFEKVKDGKDGVNNGKTYINELRKQFSTGYVLIVVAGMEYAAAVESRGKDVLTGSSLIAKDDLKKAMAAISEKLRGNK